MHSIKTTAAAALCAAAGLTATGAQAANWLMLQGTEPEAAAARARIWGFIQPEYQKDFSDANAAGAYIPPKLLGPDLESQSAFNVRRARIGVRGTPMPIDPKINYFLLLEMGNNAITAPNDAFAKLTDASVTFNYIDGARIRAGLFKYPGAEEGLQAIHVFDYVNFTDVTNQLLLERFPNSTYTGNVGPQTLPPGTDLNAFTDSVGAFRDVGVQVFDAFDVGNDWELSYAAMIGNGNGLNMTDNDDNKDVYLYLSAEKVYGGKGPRREGMKFFVWTQRGKRTLDNTNDATHNPQEYDRDRTGVGFKYLRKPWRFTAEYMTGEGMIFVGPDKPTFDINPAVPAGNGENGEASGWYVEGGWYIPGTKWEIDARYDRYNRLEDDQFEMQFDTLTLGTQYHFNKKVRAAINYEISEAEAVNLGSGEGPNANPDGVDNRIAVQLTAIF